MYYGEVVRRFYKKTSNYNKEKSEMCLFF